MYYVHKKNINIILITCKTTMCMARKTREKRIHNCIEGLLLFLLLLNELSKVSQLALPSIAIVQT